MKISKSNFIYILIYVLIVVSGNLVYVFFEISDTNMLIYLGVLSVVQWLLFLFINAEIHGSLLNYATFFSTVLFVFNFGQLVIFTFFRGVYSHVRFLFLLSMEEAIYGFCLMVLSYGCICGGELIGGITKKATEFRKEESVNRYLYWEKAAKFIIGITFPVKLVIDFVCLFISLSQGGDVARAWLNSFPNVFLYFGKVSLVGLCLLLVIYKNKPKLQNCLFFFVEIYILVMMTSGIRSENVGYLLIFLFVYLANRKERLRVSTLFKYALGGFFALTFVVAVGNFRSVTEKSFLSLWHTFLDALTKNNVAFTLLDTLGDTGYTAQCVLNKWLPIYGPSYGTSYTKGMFAIVPNIPGITDLPGKLTAESYFGLSLQEAGTLSEYYTNIGGSLIGELFFNFGIIGGVCTSTLIGFLIGRISRKSLEYFETENYYALLKYIPAMFACIYWVRNYFGGGIREVVWGPVICFAILKIFRRKQYKIY